ncbi:tetratricopeptide repeat protein [Actinoplanes regularis]|uniref:tetratricopeptide repeat protein n=1 Tax=Actinoplanes regularis TaxID=52697 RepID=UPI000B790CC4|nr:hypothetical protein [Actinoplanes regularis]
MRRQGDEYQDLAAWIAAVELLDPNGDYDRVEIEARESAHVDDVVRRARAGQDCYTQLKWATSAASQIDFAFLTRRRASGSKSLLEKFLASWRLIRRDGSEPLMELATNRVLDPRDPLLAVVDSRTGLLSARGLSPRSQAAKRLAELVGHLGCEPDELLDLFDHLIFTVGVTVRSAQDQAKHAMRANGMRCDDRALRTAVSVVGAWVRDGRRVLTADNVRAEVKRLGLLGEDRPGGGQEASVKWWARSAYVEQIRDIAPVGGLRDRADELEELARFCDGESSYLWWQAGPWAGKSALLATFVLNPPAHCDVVSFFINAWQATQSDSGACATAFIDQLSALTGEEPPASMSGSARDGHWRRLLRAAADQANAKGRRLVLVIDGLDEDRGAGPGSGMLSVAALLPKSPIGGLRVIAASRATPALPDAVPADHPLRSCQVRQLIPSPHARDVGRWAKRELREQLAVDGAGRDVLGLITASLGGLNSADLGELTNRPHYELEALLDGVLGRTVGARTGVAGSLSFMHETLAAEAAERFGRALTTYQGWIHQWAGSYQDRGWPAETPQYLLHGYAHMLAAIPDLPRLVDAATDASRHDRLLHATGGDAVAHDEVLKAYEMAVGEGGTDLVFPARLAVRHRALASRNADLPSELPAIWVNLGQPDRAEALVRGISDLGGRGAALECMIDALAEKGDLEDAEALARRINIPSWRTSRLHLRLSEVAADRGDLARAARLLDSALIDVGQLDISPRARFLARVAVVRSALDDLESAMLLMEEAATATEEVSGWEDISHTEVSNVAVAFVKLGDLDRAERMVRGLLCPADIPAGLADLAVAARDCGLPNESRAAFAEATRAAQSLTDAYERGTALAALARSCIAAGDQEHARRLLHTALETVDAVDDELEQYLWLLEDLASLAGQMGAVAEAQAIIDRAYFLIDDEYERAQVARAWAVTGRLDQAEKISEELTRPHHRADLLAKMAALLVHDVPSEAERLALRAEEAARGNRHDHWRLLGALAAATASVGDEELAEAVARTVDPEHEQSAALTGIAAALNTLGGWSRAQKAAETAEASLAAISAQYVRDEQTVGLVTVLAAAGQLDGAERLAMTVFRPAYRIDALRAVAVASEPGQRAMALARKANELIDRLYRREERDYAFGDLAEAYAHAGERSDAEAAVNRIVNDIISDRATFEIAKAAVVIGDYATAETITRTIADEYVRDDAIAMTAEHLADTADLESASSLLHQIVDRGCRARVATAIAASAGKQGDWATAEQHLDQIDEQYLNRFLARLALTAAKAGDSARARRYLLRALPSADLTMFLPAIAAIDPATILFLARQAIAEAATKPQVHAT